jgi:hypothetical protein
MRRLPLLLASLLAVPTSHAVEPDVPARVHWAGDQAGLFEEALDLMGLTWEEFRFDPAVVALWGGDRWRLPLFSLFFEDPWSVSPYAREHARAAARASESVSNLLYLAQADTGIRVRDNFYGTFLGEAQGDVEADGELALARALEALGAGDAEAIAAQPEYEQTPRTVRDAAALILHVMRDAEVFRRIALEEPLLAIDMDPDEALHRAYEELFWRDADDDDANLQGEAKFDEVSRMLEAERMLEAVDFHILAKGAILIGLGVDGAIDRLSPQPDDEADRTAALEALAEAAFSFTIETRLGVVRLVGAGDHAHPPVGADPLAHDLLVIDTAGDDLWTRAATSTDFNHAIAVVIDLSGDDRYRAPDMDYWQARLDGPKGGEPGFRQERPDEHRPDFGTGLGGYGVLVDLAGRDTYAVPFGGLGCGLLGYGALLDVEGDDTYQADSGAMGCGVFGAGVHADLDGDDEYRLLRLGMGYGGTRGCGILVDTGGDDQYLADTEHVKYSWFNNYNRQLNMSQGFGFGRRADMGDGHSWAGGVGMLVDTGAGDDRYHCDIYGIGSAYWYALGICYDDGGDDDYRSYGYSIASPPHFAVGVVIDEWGNDVYRGSSSRACGFGRDFSLGWFEDGGGNDRYYCVDSAFGVGNVNGLGVCWDKSGDDVYIARSNSFGRPFIESTGNRRDFPVNAGLFIDGGGADRYHRLPDDADTDDSTPFDWGDGSQFPAWDFISDGARHSWRGLLEPPGATGAAVDSE